MIYHSAVFYGPIFRIEKKEIFIVNKSVIPDYNRNSHQVIRFIMFIRNKRTIPLSIFHKF